MKMKELIFILPRQALSWPHYEVKINDDLIRSDKSQKIIREVIWDVDKSAIIHNKPDFLYVVDDKLVIPVHVRTIFKKTHFEGWQTQNYFIDRITWSKIFGDDWYTGKEFFNDLTQLL